MQQTFDLNIELLKDLVKFGAKSYWLNVTPETKLPRELIDAGVKEIPAPTAHGTGLPLAEIVPFQLISVAFAESRGVPPGEFRFVGKVTTKE